MSNKKGLTLVEIILAIALLGIISVMLFPALTSQYALLRQTRVMTADLYTAQQNVELVISNVKKAIQAGTSPVGQTRTSYVLFAGKFYQRTVYGYPNQIEVHAGNGAINLSTVVADTRMPEFDVATVSNVNAKLYDATSVIANAYADTPSLKVVGNFLLSDPKNVNLTNIYRWYVSREGFYTPMITNPLEIESGSVYPSFPEDYVLIKNVSTLNLLSILHDYAGKHLLFTVTPASDSGKMGATVPSNPVFLSGLPVITNLRLHLDASMVSFEDATSLRTVATTVDGQPVNTYFVKKWNDISGKANNAVKIDSNNNSQPELKQANIGDIVVNDTQYKTYAKFVRFSGAQGLTIPDTDWLDLNDLTVIVVAKSTDTTALKNIVSKTNSTTGWFTGWNSVNQLGSTFRNTSVNTVSATVGSGLDGEWHILAASTTSATNKSTFQVDRNPVVTTDRTTGATLTNIVPISIGYDGSLNFSNVDVAEIIIYSGVLTPTDQNSIYTYLEKKYQPAPVIVTINALKPITDTVLVGEPYPLPSMIPAYMSNSTIQNVAVNWSDPIYTSTVGLKTSTATAVANPLKTTTIQVNVVLTRNLESIGAISGTPQVGNVLTAGALTPAGATATYQWQIASSSGGTYVDIAGATANTYTPVTGDIGQYLKVVATGTGSYTGSVTSAAIPVSKIPLTAIGAISGTPQVGSVLTAGALTPAGATATYQWQSASSSGGIFTDIAGATSITYTPDSGDTGGFIRVKATGTANYTGIVTSAETGVYEQLTGIGAISGTAQVHGVLTAGALTPAGATASYQWQSAATSGGTYTDIAGATASTYTIATGDFGRFIRLEATGTGYYTGIVTSAATSAVTRISLSGITISGTAQVRSVLTAGALTPAGATAAYQWQSAATSGGTYTDIAGAIASTYTIVSGDIGRFIRLEATGTGDYTGIVYSSATSAVTRISLSGITISGTAQVRSVLTAGTLTPAGATAAYQWQSAATSGGTYTDIAGATASTYTIVSGDFGRFIRLEATGTGDYTGIVNSSATSAVTRISLSGITISGTAQVRSVLTAGALTPAGATAAYQWQSAATSGGTYTDIAGATASTYTIVSGDFGRFIRLEATGTGDYTGIVNSSATSAVTRISLSGITISGTAQVRSVLTAGALTPAGATAAYQWQSAATSGGTYTDIAGATASTYTIVSGNIGRFIRLEATGTGDYTGIVFSSATSAVTRISLTGIGAITRTGTRTSGILTAGALTPTGATVTYQWQRATTSGGTYSNIGTSSTTYQLVSTDSGRFFRVIATATGDFTGAVTSAVFSN